MAADREGPSAEDIVFAALARDDLAKTQNYLERGRRFADLSDESLASRWVHEIRTWAKSVHRRPTALNDADAEYMLRGQEAPYHLVTAEVEAILVAVFRVNEAMSDEDRARANAVMTAEYEADQRSRN